VFFFFFFAGVILFKLFFVSTAQTFAHSTEIKLASNYGI